MTQLSTQINQGLENSVGRLREQLRYLETGVPVMSDSLTHMMAKVQALETDSMEFQSRMLQVNQACQGSLSKFRVEVVGEFKKESGGSEYLSSEMQKVILGVNQMVKDFEPKVGKILSAWEPPLSSANETRLNHLENSSVPRELITLLQAETPQRLKILEDQNLADSIADLKRLHIDPITAQCVALDRTRQLLGEHPPPQKRSGKTFRNT